MSRRPLCNLGPWIFLKSKQRSSLSGRLVHKRELALWKWMFTTPFFLAVFADSSWKVANMDHSYNKFKKLLLLKFIDVIYYTKVSLFIDIIMMSPRYFFHNPGLKYFCFEKVICFWMHLFISYSWEFPNIQSQKFQEIIKLTAGT